MIHVLKMESDDWIQHAASSLQRPLSIGQPQNPPAKSSCTPWGELSDATGIFNLYNLNTMTASADESGGSIQHSCDCKHWNNGSSIQHSCCIQSHFHLASIRIWNVHSNDHSSLRWHCNDWQTYLWGALLRFDSAKLEWTQKYLSALHMLTGHHVGLVISCVRCFNTAVVGMLLSESSCSYNSKWSAFDEQSATCNNWDFENMHSSSYSGDATLC